MPFQFSPKYVNRQRRAEFTSRELPMTVVPNMTPEDEENLHISTPAGTDFVPDVGMNADAASTSTGIGGGAA